MLACGRRAVGTMPSLRVLLLAHNPLSFPPSGVIAQGPTAVLEYVRRHRHADLMTSDAERSLKQVLAQRERLANTVDAHEESHRSLARGGGGAPRAEIEEEEEVTPRPAKPKPKPPPPPESEEDEQANSPGSAAGGERPRRSRNAGYFE